MPPSNIIRGSIFAAGLLVGVGAGGAIFAKRERNPSGSSQVVEQGISPSAAKEKGRNGSVVEVEDRRVVLTGHQTNQVSAQILKHGFPGPIPDILKRTAYIAAYDRRLRHPSWTAEHLSLANLGRSSSPSPSASPSPSSNSRIVPAPTSSPTKGDRSRSQFIEDEEIPAMFRAQLKDYFRSGYDRGHMVPAADAKISQLAMDETFLLTNIAPQVGDGFNRHYWAYLEDFCRRLTGNFDDVYVFTVPLYLPKQEADGKWRVSYEVIGSPPSISVPTHFAKVILTSKSNSVINAAKEMSIGAFVLPNAVIPDNAPLTSFAVPVEAVEKAAGLNLFSPTIKGSAKALCRETKCELVVRRFDDAKKQVQVGDKARGGQNSRK